MSPSTDPDGNPVPLRSIAPDTPITAKIRATPGSAQVLHTFAAALVAIVLGVYGPDPVIVAQLGEISHTVTGAWTWEHAVWDLLVDHRLVVPAAQVTAPWVVSR